MEADQIRLYRDGEMWMARSIGPHAAEVRRLFGTDTLPTAYRAAFDGERVRAAIAERNPGVDVTLCELVVPYGDR